MANAGATKLPCRRAKSLVHTWAWLVSPIWRSVTQRHTDVYYTHRGRPFS
jgi:hypothetical protein